MNELVEIVLHQETEYPVAEPQRLRLRRRSLVVTTVGYIECFAVWTIFAIIGIA